MNNPAPSNHNRDAVIMQWKSAATEAETSKKRESELRDEVVDICFPTPKVGMNTLDLGHGYKLKAEVKQNYSVQHNGTPGDYSNVQAALSKLNPEIASGLIKWKAELSVSAYKQLTAEEREVVNTFVTITDGKPSLKLEEPKGA